MTARLSRSGRCATATLPSAPSSATRARVDAVLDPLDAGDGARARGSASIAGPVVGRRDRRRRSVTPVAVGATLRDAGAAQRAGRAVEELLEGLVEAPHAAEAGGQRHLGHRQARLVDQLLGEQHAPGLGDRDRRGAEMLLEQPPQLPLADAEPLGQRLDVGLVASSAPSAISASARDTVFEVPRQEARSGEVSGRQRRQGRKPASCAAAAVGKKRQFSNFGVRAGQIGRQ